MESAVATLLLAMVYTLGLFVLACVVVSAIIHGIRELVSGVKTWIRREEGD